MRSTLIAALFAATALSSHVANAQTCGEMRGRLAVVPYKPLTMYECNTSPDVATSIVAASGETIGPNSAPDTDKVLLSTAANMLVFHATQDEIGKSPNLTFETKTADGQFRQYYFIFHVIQSGGIAAIQLTYPEDEATVKKAAAVERQEAARNQLIQSKLKTAVFSGRPNWQYDCRCAAGRSIEPIIWDNGTETLLRYVGSTPSAITVARLDRDGTEKSPDDVPHQETIVSFNPLNGPQGDLLVIPQTSEYWRIRSGNQVIDIWNKNYHPELIDYRTGTQSPDVVRVIKPTTLPARPIAPAAQPTAPRVAER